MDISPLNEAFYTLLLRFEIASNVTRSTYTIFPAKMKIINQITLFPKRRELYKYINEKIINTIFPRLPAYMFLKYFVYTRPK